VKQSLAPAWLAEAGKEKDASRNHQPLDIIQNREIPRFVSIRISIT
jgi:hypothetical protein